MAEQLLTRRSEAPRVTLKVQRVANPTTGSPWPRRLLLLLGVAVGGAILGQLGSALLSSMLQGRGSNGSSIVTRAASLAERQAEIDAVLLSRDASAALLLIDDALAHFPNDPQLVALRRRTEEDVRNRFRYQAFEQMIAKRNFPAALALFDELGNDSPYRHRASQELPALRARYIADQMEAAQAAAKLGLCSEARQLAGRVQALEPAHSGARTLNESCTTDTSTARRP